MTKEPPKANSNPPQKKRGFVVGPANLPDGTYKRKVDKLKKALIHKAKVKKSFHKTLAADADTDAHAQRAHALLEEAARLNAESSGHEATSAQMRMHPSRQAALEKRQEQEQEHPRPHRKPKTPAFKKEEAHAARLKAEREAAARAREEKERIRRQKEAERNRRRKVMGERTIKGQQKLGKQSLLLLEKVQSQMAK